jgi:transposase
LRAVRLWKVRFNIRANYALLDAGYCSEKNIVALYQAGISFLMRIPSGRLICREAAEKALPSLETIDNCVLYGKRVLYIKREKITLYGEYEGYAYIYLDVKKRADDITRIMTDAIQNREDAEKTREKLKTAGIFTLLSPEEMQGEEVLKLYYLRQSAEQIFEISKSYADILPLRVHQERTLRGILMINFLAVALYKNLNKQLPDAIPLSNALKFLRTQKCKIFDSGALIPSEPNKRQRIILQAVADTVGIFSGA